MGDFVIGALSFLAGAGVTAWGMSWAVKRWLF